MRGGDLQDRLPVIQRTPLAGPASEPVRAVDLDIGPVIQYIMGKVMGNGRLGIHNQVLPFLNIL